jgi:hypothetical protein
MCRLGVALLLAAMLALAGCSPDRPDAPAPISPSPTRTLPPTTLPPGTTLGSSLPRLLRVVDGYHQFEVSAQQYELIGRRVGELFARERLLDRGARFGANFDPDKRFYFVLIDPGFSGMSARQILDRLLA